MKRQHLVPATRRVASAAITVALVASLGGCGLFQRNEHEASATPPESGKTVEQTDQTVEVNDQGLSAVATEGYAYEGEMMYPSTDEGWVEFNTEEYDTVEESGFISAATRPLSTVSADVDTASYCNLRRMLRDGYRVQGHIEEDLDDGDEWNYYDSAYIPTGAVRIEEMLNYFSYDYVTPKAGSKDLFATTVHVGDCPWNANTKLVTLGFATAPEAASIAEKGSNLVFLIDVSGSMDSADKLDLLKDAFDELVSHLGEKDRVSIVTYASGEDVVLEGAHGDETRKIMRAINHLRANGATNGEAGLQMAYKVARDNYIEGGVNRIVMASDGDLNVGMSSESDLHDYVDKQRDSGIYLSVLGFGSGNYKDNKMETLADHGNGSYHYIDCIEEAERVLGQNLTANLVPLCDDVKVQVEFNPAQVKGYRLIGYENRAMADEDFRNDEKDAGDVGPGAQFTVAYEVALVGSEQEVVTTDLKYDNGSAGDKNSDEWLTATVRYRPADGSEVREQSQVVSKDDWSKKPGEDWNFQAAVIEFGMLLRSSEYAGTSDYDSITKLVGDVDEKAADREGFLKLVDLALE